MAIAAGAAAAVTVAAVQGLPEVVARWSKLPYEVLILGETGTGKTVLAGKIHEMSGRAGAFVDCSLAQLPEPTAVSELFGHVRGAFTGAVTERVGHLEAARGGTLFLDELGDCPRAVQGMLLKALESKRIQRMGERRFPSGRGD